MFKLIAASAALAAASFGIANAGDRDNFAFNYKKSEVATDAGRAETMARLEAEAEEYCGGDHARSQAEAYHIRRCAEKLVKKTSAQIDRKAAQL